MHIRVSSVTRRGKTYSYAQLVESYRRPKDGMPAHRVLASLGRLDPQTIANLKAALAASRKGRAVVVPEVAAPSVATPPVRANRRYLDLAVLRALWKRWQMPELLADAWQAAEVEVPMEAVVEALVLQRCVAPGSKRLAARWFPTTALPELLSVTPGRFNNTRIHRALDSLAAAEEAVQSKLGQRVSRREGAFGTLFLDVTDTWFVGQGPEVAQKRKTKEGLYRRKIGVVALCDSRGYPLRWQVVPGRRHDSKVMGAMVESLADVPWAREVPIVLDRAMGRTAHIEQLRTTGMHFVTALTRPEFDAFGGEHIPFERFVQVGPPSSEDAWERLGREAEAAGMQRVQDNLFVLDLGIITRETPAPASRSVADTPDEDPTVQRMKQALTMRAQLDTGEATSYRDVGRLHGVSKSRAYEVLLLTRLPTDLQQAILDGRARGVRIKPLYRVCQLSDPEDQRAEFDRLIAAATTRRRRKGSAGGTTSAGRPARTAPGPLSVRAVVYFNPEMLLTQREHAESRLAAVRAHVRGINAKLRSPNSHRTDASAYAAVEHYLRKHDLVDAFEVVVDHGEADGRPFPQVRAHLKPEVWARRRRYDGFSLLVAHPDILRSGPELCRMYRAKDVLEKDFHIIKSVVEIRPVWHYTDPKVRAHIAICMLALLLCRTLENELAKAGHQMSAQAAIEALATCHLNELQPDGVEVPFYSVTRPTNEQTAILRALNLQELVDDQAVAEVIQPR